MILDQTANVVTSSIYILLLAVTVDRDVSYC